MTLGELRELSRQIRIDVVKSVGTAKSGHVGGSVSCAEILATLYFGAMQADPKLPSASRDKCVLSKGHAAPALYSVLAHRGYFPREELLTLRQLGSRFQGHPDMKKTPGVDASTGSLGQGVSIAVGMALGARLHKSRQKIFVLVGDGEAQEGQFWEAMMSAAHYKLTNLTVIMDNNGLQIDGTNDQIMSLGDIKAKLSAFGFAVIEVDGHSIPELLAAYEVGTRQPKFILAHTVKGKGISFMENQVGWHGKAPNADEMQRALDELEAQDSMAAAGV
jgi:transketolase